MLFMRRFIGFLGGALALFCLTCIIAVAGLHGAYTVGAKIAACIFFLGMAAGFGFLARWGFRKPGPDQSQPEVHSAQIREILQLAKAAEGELTLMQVAADTTLSIEESRQFLEELVTEGMAQMIVDEAGVILYQFPDFHPSRTADSR